MNPRLILLGLLFILSWILYLDRAAISTAKELVASDLSLSDESMGLVFGAFALGYGIAQVPSGWFADRFGPRIALAAVVVGWSFFTSLTGVVTSLSALVAVRFLFGIAEAGAFPGSARAFFNWLAPETHGRANGFIFSGSRLGAALSFPFLAYIMSAFGWRGAFLFLGLPGFVWALIWFLWFRDNPPEPVARTEPAAAAIRFVDVFRSGPMLMAMGQYFASNFTFFICLSWMHPYLMRHYKLSRDEAGWYSMIVLLVGATAQWISGFLVDRLYRTRWREHSRRIPAMAGFLLSAVALALLSRAETVTAGVSWFAIATFGAEMTISPSWAFCISLGGKNSGAVSGSMNMIGNFGSFVSASIFPWLTRNGDAGLFFQVAAVLNVAATVLWLGMHTKRRLPQQGGRSG